MIVSNKVVREGYKMTEVGEIPVDWEIKTLADVTKLIKDGSHNPPPRTEEGIPMLSAENIFGGKVNFGLNEKNISFNDFYEMHKNYQITVGDVLMTIVGTLGRTAVVKNDRPFTLQRSVAIFKTNDLINSNFLEYTLNANYIKKQINNRANITAQAGIYLKELAKLLINLPPLKEQQKIADILSTVDEQIENTEQLIEKTKELKKGLMQQLLTKGIGHTEFKQTELGEIPAEWELKSLGEISNIKGRVGWKGYTKNDLRNSGPLTLGATHIDNNNRIDLSNPVYLSQEKYDESPEIKVAKDDILFVQRGSLGKLALIRDNIGPATINPSMVLIKEIRVNAYFLYYYLCSDVIQKKINAETSQTSIPMLSQSQINVFKVPLPTDREQQKIASILSSVDEQIDSYEQEKEKYLELKKGLMQQLLTGKIRVTV